MIAKWRAATPRASARTQRLAAALSWTVVAIVLVAVGVHWLVAAGTSAVALVAVALVAGVLKGRFVLSRSARKNVARLDARPDGTCFFGYLSWRGWALIPLMMALGFALRHSPLSRPALGTIYAAIGVALATGSAPMWNAWRRDAAHRDLS